MSPAVLGVWSPAARQWRAPGCRPINVGDVDDGFIVEETEPVPGVNVGCRVPTGSLTSVSGNLIVTAGMTGPGISGSGVVNEALGINDPIIIAGLNVEGGIEVRTPNVIIRDCLTRLHGSGTIGQGVRVWHSSAVNVRIEHTSIIVDPADYANTRGYGIQGCGFVAYRVYISGTVDGFSFAGINKKSYAHAEGCFIENLPKMVDTGQSDGFTHNDDFQIEGNLSAVSVRGCVLRSGRTSCILITRDYGSGVYDTAPIITGNWLRIQEKPGALINVKGGITPINGLTIARNRVTRDEPTVARFYIRDAQLAVTAITATGADKNYYDTGSTADVVPIYNGTSQLYSYGSAA